jgi:hypothetical protein
VNEFNHVWRRDVFRLPSGLCGFGFVCRNACTTFEMTNPHQTFKDARSKAQWAKHHIRQLFAEYRALLDSDLTRLVIEDDFEPGTQRVKIVPATEFPPSIPLIIGDAVHNLRTAFDYIIVAITGMDWIALPLGKTRDDVITKCPRYRTIKTAFPALATFIIDDIQPYCRGQFRLWELSELDRIDKHRLILPTINQAHRLGMKVEDQSGKRTNFWFTATDGFSTTQTFLGPVKVHHEGHAALSVSFGPGTPFEGQPVLETLDKFSELALQAIERFERFHFGA